MKRSRIARKPGRRRNKFGVRTDAAGVRGRTFLGREYHSQLEARYAASLELRKRATLAVDRISSWRPQVPVKLEVNGKLICTYIVDFLVTYPNGHEEYVEVKGFETDTWKLKDKLFRALFPDRKLTVVR